MADPSWTTNVLGSGTARCCCICTVQMFRVHSPDGSTFLCEMMPCQLSWKCDVGSENKTLSIGAYLCEKNSSQLSFRSSFKRRSLRLLWRTITTRWVAIWDQFLIQKWWLYRSRLRLMDAYYHVYVNVKPYFSSENCDDSLCEFCVNIVICPCEY